ncbi:MAG TPA: STAS/SEC14 domain-containing protein [Ornithinimicrobium sp.]|uniref:STAS/SEC14 domain-containing protein n=1 Tax=Ornithinimicrobium sp. TaxID=1977084 RepID=UPI002B464BC5|nr:STAS/SEC14 domain-containing protein [Ornithinimicrobium sp.]HKJ11088.1 STAS/SEC14 domain-containing protein [Ornithinimicrobium sp.]
MANSRVIDGTDIVAVDFPGRLQDDELAELRDLAGSVAAERGHASLLVEYADADPDAVDARVVWRELQRLAAVDGAHRCAVVTDAALADALATSRGEERSTELEVFAAEQRDDALFWLRE